MGAAVSVGLAVHISQFCGDKTVIKQAISLKLQLPGQMNFTRTEIKYEGIHLTFQDNLWEHSYKNKRERGQSQGGVALRGVSS